MADITRDHFLESRGVLKKIFQKNIPLLDADLNEQIDIVNTRQMRFLSAMTEQGHRRFGEGFNVIPDTPAGNTCVVKAGFIAVEIDTDLSVLIRLATDTDVTGWTTPSGNRTDYLYVDVSFDEIDSTEDSNLINPSADCETAIDYRMSWQFVKSQGGTTSPPSGHVYVALAQIQRGSGDSQITSDDITMLVDDIITDRAEFNIAGDLFVGNDIDCDGAVNILETLDISGKVTIDDDQDITGNLDVDGTANIAENLTCQNDIILSPSNTVDGVDVSALGDIIYSMPLLVDISSSNNGVEAVWSAATDSYPAFTSVSASGEEVKGVWMYVKQSQHNKIKAYVENYSTDTVGHIILRVGSSAEHDITSTIGGTWNGHTFTVDISSLTDGQPYEIKFIHKNGNTLRSRKLVIWATYE